MSPCEPDVRGRGGGDGEVAFEVAFEVALEIQFQLFHNQSFRLNVRINESR